MKHYDLIVIGSGPAGEKGAAQAAWFGKSVAVVERRSFPGGACVNTGTVPSKTLREAALLLTGFRQRELFGIDLALREDGTLAGLMQRKVEVIDREHERIDHNLARHSIDRIQGNARFVSPREIVVESPRGEDHFTADVFLIATGSAPLRPRSIPIDDQLIYDSDSILELDRIPHTLAVIGAGVIGCEYASIFAALGAKVWLVNSRPALLPFVDREIADALARSMVTRLSMELCLGSEVDSVERHGEEVHLRLGNGTVLVAEKVLVAAGRTSNIEGLGLEAAGVATGERGLILVDEQYRTSVPNIYAAGDVIGFPALASTSMEQARVAMVHAFDLKYKTRMAPLLPYGIYTIPEIAMGGMTEEQCVEKGLNYAVGRAWYRNNARGQIIGDTEGLVKLVFDSESLKLLGVHIVGENATELLHVGMMVMQFDGTINAFIESVFNYPTLGDAYKYAAYDGLGAVARARVFRSMS